MKKSPGKWIKTVLFGKKISKSSLSKNATPDKKSDAKATVAGDSEPSQLIDRGVENIEIEKSLSVSPCATNTSDPQNNFVSVQLYDDEVQRQDQAATKTQAAFRGYLARRAFRALKGITRLQALIRGHLVRRQAIATLRCMQAIVKLQALTRGQKDANLDIGSNSFFPLTNPFIRKLLVSLPTAMPLSLQYEPAEPNSSWNWLERWSLSHFWELPTKTKKIPNSKPQKKHSNAQNAEPDSTKSKRTIQKVSTAINGDSSALSSLDLETEKSKCNPRKIISHQTESVLEHQQNELERIKRNLKKVSASAAAASEKSEIETDETIPISEKEIVIISEKTSVSDITVEKPVLLEASSEKIEIFEPVDIPDNNTVVETKCSENGEKTENSLNLQEELGSKEEENGTENQKLRKRKSLPVKHEYTENISQNNPSRPSYMAATESAKAKLRAQGPAKISEDGVEYGNVRRHSLPASTNGKMSSMSPRIQKLVQAKVKGGGKTNKMLTASKDGWRR